MDSNTEILIYLESITELEDLLKKIKEIKKENPNTKIRIEVRW